MTAMSKPQENSVTNDIIRKVHLSLADLKSGEEIIGFLRTTEPIFMNEVSRFINTEMARMRYQVTETQAMYMSSIIGASYIAGFLIAREANYKMFDGLLNVKSDIAQALSPAEIDRLIDAKRGEGKSYKEIAKVIKQTISDKTKKNKAMEKKSKTTRGKRLDLGSLD